MTPNQVQTHKCDTLTSYIAVSAVIILAHILLIYKEGRGVLALFRNYVHISTRAIPGASYLMGRAGRNDVMLKDLGLLEQYPWSMSL